jgi:selenocysteine-specific elongation factor
VLDIAPRRWRKKHLDEHLTLLNRIKTALTASGGPKHETLVEHHVRQRGISGTDLRDLGSLTGLTEAKLQATLRQLESILRIPTEPPVFVAEGVIEAIKEKVCNYLDRYHEAKPLSSGCPREELRERFLPGDTGNLFQFVLEKWQEAGEIDIRGSVVARQGRAVKLSEEQETTRARLLEAIARSNLITPTLDELATQVGGDPDLVRNVFFYLLEAREIWRISGNMVLLPSQFVFLRDRLRNRFPSGSVFTVSEFKDLFSVSRKYAIPLLELLDREKVTRRTGNKRMVI